MQLPVEFVNYIAKYSYLIFIFLMLQGSLLVILFYLFIDKFTSSKKVKLQESTVKQEAYTKALSILEEAKDSSLKIVEDANKRAQVLLGDVQLVTDDVRRDLNDQLQALADKHIQVLSSTNDEFISSFKKALGDESQKTTDVLEQTTTIVRDALLSEVDQFKDILRKETFETEEQLKNRIQDEYAAVRDELDEYKKSKLASIDAKIYEIVYEVASNVTGKSLDVDSHQAVVIQFLEQAKKEHRLP
ncbi:hypothetical protein GYA27_00350 [candidate division WWE3 bacterium]|uniref:Uncharacterized protein n=1 Tax=candidate division WWE3 bacterium TaxID=2053526 RepID=A0A7X9DK37_UNCKA|nr:hypothetical protein [candidate division WWE3 bacterium]